MTPPAPLSTVPRLGRRERHRLQTRERLFRAALRLFAARGFQATTVEEITEAADVGKGTFFNYFPSKEHIIAAFGEMQLGKLQAAVAAARAGSLRVRQVLGRLAHALAQEPGRSPALVRSMLLANLASEPVRQMIHRNLARGRQLMAELIALGQKRGEVRRDRAAIELAQTFQQVFFGTLMLWAVHPTCPLRERLDATLPLLWSGIAAGPSRNRKERRT